MCCINLRIYQVHLVWMIYTRLGTWIWNGLEEAQKKTNTTTLRLSIGFCYWTDLDIGITGLFERSTNHSWPSWPWNVKSSTFIGYKALATWGNYLLRLRDIMSCPITADISPNCPWVHYIYVYSNFYIFIIIASLG